MTYFKWFKFDFRMFDTAELKYLAKAGENGTGYQLLWIKLLCEAAKRNDGGKIYITKNAPISLYELSIITDTSEELITEAIKLFEKLELIQYDSETGFVIKNFIGYFGESSEDDDGEAEDPRSEEEIRREYNREAKRRSRERQRQREAQLLAEGGVIQSNRRSKDYVKDDVINSDCAVKADERSASKAVKTVKKAVKELPKDIFIEEKRSEESRKEDNRKEEIRKENKNENYPPLTLPHGCADAHGEENAVDVLGDNEDIGARLPFSDVSEEEKKRYGIFNNVYLTDSELIQLREKFGDMLEGLIEDLSTGMESDGRSYNNHFATLLRWGKNEYAARRARNSDGGAQANNGAGAARGNSKGEARHGRAQKNDSRGYSSESMMKNMSTEEAEEAFRLALERSKKLSGLPCQLSNKSEASSSVDLR